MTQSRTSVAYDAVFEVPDQIPTFVDVIASPRSGAIKDAVAWVDEDPAPLSKVAITHAAVRLDLPDDIQPRSRVFVYFVTERFPVTQAIALWGYEKDGSELDPSAALQAKASGRWKRLYQRRLAHMQNERDPDYARLFELDRRTNPNLMAHYTAVSDQVDAWGKVYKRVSCQLVWYLDSITGEQRPCEESWTREDLEEASRRLIEGLGAEEKNLSAVRQSLVRFACGELGHKVIVAPGPNGFFRAGEPDSGLVFLFAELGFQCLEPRFEDASAVDEWFWREMLETMVRIQIYFLWRQRYNLRRWSDYGWPGGSIKPDDRTKLDEAIDKWLDVNGLAVAERVKRLREKRRQHVLLDLASLRRAVCQYC